MRLFVWDLHGTLERGNENAVKEISNKALASLGYTERLSLKDCQRLYGEKWFKYFEYLLPNEIYEKHLQLQSTAIDISNERPDIIRKYVRPTHHAHKVLEEISDSIHNQILISNTNPESLEMFLETLAIRRFFCREGTYAINGYERKLQRSKEEALREHLEGKNYDKIIIIGDTARDMGLIKVAGGTTYLYTHPNKRFQSCEADYYIRDLREVLREL